MSGQGKSLQDIYDEGSRRLEESEKAQRAGLEQAGTQAAEGLGQLESSMTAKLNESLSDLEAEVRSYLNRAVEAINAAVNSEVEENRKFLERLQETLKLSCQSLSEDVRQLQEWMLRHFDSNADNCFTLQRREMDKGVSRLQADASGSAAYLKELAQAGSSGFSSRAASHVLHVLDKSNKVPVEFFQEFSRHAVSIDKRINDCVQLLSSRSKEINTDISAGQLEVQQRLDQLVQQLTAALQGIYDQSDSNLKKHCEDALAQALLHQEERSKQLATEMLESGNANGSGVLEKSATLKTDTDHLLEQVKQLLCDVDAGIRQDCQNMTEQFGESLKDRLEGARNHNQMVADERNQLMERIAGDLQTIETDFNERLSQLAQKCQARLSSLCVDAELAIVGAHDACAAEFKSLSAQQQKEIEAKTQELLSSIDTLSQQAITNIKTAAGDNGNTPSAQSAPAATSESGKTDVSSSGNPFGDFGDLKL